MAASITVSRCARAPIAFAPWRKNTRRPRGLGRSGGGEFSRGGEEIEVAARAPGLSARAFDLARAIRAMDTPRTSRARGPRAARDPPPSTPASRVPSGKNRLLRVPERVRRETSDPI